MFVESAGRRRTAPSHRRLPVKPQHALQAGVRWSTCSTATSVAGWRNAAAAPRAIALILSGWRFMSGWVAGVVSNPTTGCALRERPNPPALGVDAGSWPAIPAERPGGRKPGAHPRRSGSHGAAGPLHRAVATAAASSELDWTCAARDAGLTRTRAKHMLGKATSAALCRWVAPR
jgi:hypothetical protein